MQLRGTPAHYEITDGKPLADDTDNHTLRLLREMRDEIRAVRDEYRAFRAEVLHLLSDVEQAVSGLAYMVARNHGRICSTGKPMLKRLRRLSRP